MNQNNPWQNPDLWKIANGLGTTEKGEPVPYLAQMLGALEIFRIPPSNRKLKSFNISDMEVFQGQLNAWYNSVDGPSMIISTEYIKDDTGTNIYLVTYA